MGNLAELLNRDAEIGDADAAARATQGADTEDVAEPIAIQKVSSDTREKARGKALDQAQGTPGEDVIDPIEPEITQELPQVEGSPTERAARVALQGSPGPIEMQAPPRALPSDMGARGITAPEMTVGQQRVAADNERIQLESSPDFQHVMGIMGGDQQATADRLYAAAVYQASDQSRRRRISGEESTVSKEYLNILNKLKIAMTPEGKAQGVPYEYAHDPRSRSLSALGPDAALTMMSKPPAGYSLAALRGAIRKALMAGADLAMTPEEQAALAQLAEERTVGGQ